MNIALLAHDSKKELMVQFCIAYCGILSGHDLCAPTTTGKLISDATGRENTKDIDSIARLCDQHSIPFASNVATAEVLIQGLQRGDLDWRNIVNPKKK